MERATKVFVLAWTAAALAVEVVLVGRSLSALVPLSAGLFLASALLVWRDRRAMAIVLAAVYIFPAIFRMAYGRYHVYFGVLWMAAFLGAMVPDLVRTSSSWRIPLRWRAPLVLFALTLAVSGSLVVWREIDFYPALLGELGSFRVPSSVGGGSPAFSTIWVLRVALVLLLGLLWFEWLFAAPVDFHKLVVTPLAASALVMAGVAIYQLFVDVTFFNETVYGNIGRASGTLFDANVCGVIAALWIGGFSLWASDRGLGRAATVAGVAIGWLAVWASGSRTAFGAAVIVTACSLIALYKALLPAGSSRRPWRPVVAALVASAALLVVLSNLPADVVGPLGRVRDTLPGLSVESVRAFVAEMWNRNGYGAVATRMIGESPWFGVGLGSFHLLVSDFAQLAWPGFILPSDNAQNWYRHQIAELGLVGSLGWILWVVGFAWFVVRPRAGALPSIWVARGMLLAFGAVSLLGMPGQDMAAVVTFWTMAFWFVLLAEPSLVRSAPASGQPLTWLSRSTLAVAFVIVAVYGAGTAYLSATWLRVPLRAERLGWPFSYGFYYPEPDGEGGEQRWARRRAVAVVDAPGRWLVLRVSVNHLDLEANPVQARVWLGRTLVLDTELSTTTPVVKYVEVPDGHTRVTIETEVNRTVRPRDLGAADQRELGLLVGWRFVDRPPGDAR
jgi:hypothetical protein